MALTADEIKIAKELKRPEKQKLPEKVEVKKYHITSINAPGILHETVAGQCLMMLSSGLMSWYSESDVVSY